MKKNNKIKILHIAIIVLGIIFISIPVFHSNLWFDESYTVAISNHSFQEILTIGSHDVHPVLYYWILHIINLIFGSNILIYRLFSTLCIALVGILGYTHIRKDFGEKTGLIFSFLAFFLPVNVVYAGEIRMYTLAMLEVTLMSIYAYRIYKNRDKKYIKNWIIFAIFSLASAYTHYYGLMIAGIVNLFLFISLVIEAKKQRKFTYNLKAFCISAIAQIVLYLPWLLIIMSDLSEGVGGFWIGIHFPDTFISLFTFPFVGNIEGTEYIKNVWAIMFGLAITVYMIYIYVKNRKNAELKPSRMAIGFWAMELLAACLVSLLIWQPIIYARYMFCVGGLFIFFLAHTIATKGNIKINIAICTVSLILSIIVTGMFVNENYGKANKEFLDYVNENIEEGDIIICGNKGGGFGSGFVVAAEKTGNQLYFWDQENWNVGEAYKAFGETVYDLDFLKDYTGRIWMINANLGNYQIYDDAKELYDLKLIEQKEFKVEYKGYEYMLTLVEKEE